jgi:hypothetical protein
MSLNFCFIINLTVVFDLRIYVIILVKNLKTSFIYTRNTVVDLRIYPDLLAGKFWEAWWLNGSAPDCCPAVLGSDPVSPQPTADCQSPDGLPPGMALGWGLTSVRGDRGENHEK